MREPTTVTDRLFLVAVLLKGLDGAVQLVSGVLLAFLPPEALTRLAHAVVTRDLVGPPTGALAGHFEEAVRHFAAGDRTFVLGYLLLHGAIKLLLAVALVRRALPMYPVAVGALGLFVVAELVRAAQTRSIVLPLLAVLDVVIIVLVVEEYRELRPRR